MAAIAIYSVKGGVGKSTLAANLAWYSAQAGHRTLLWDLDAAGAGGFLYGIEPDRAARSIKLFGGQAEADPLIWHSGYANLDVLPGDASLRGLDAALVKLGKRRRLAKLLGRFGEEYTRIIIDCPPVLNEISAQVIRGVDAIVLPLTPSALSHRALEQVRAELVKNHPRHPPALPVLSMVDMRRTLHRQAVETHPDWPAVPMASALEQAAGQGVPIGAAAPASAAAQAIARLWAGIDRKLSGAAARDKAPKVA